MLFLPFSIHRLSKHNKNNNLKYIFARGFINWTAEAKADLGLHWLQMWQKKHSKLKQKQTTFNVNCQLCLPSQTHSFCQSISWIFSLSNLTETKIELYKLHLCRTTKKLLYVYCQLIQLKVLLNRGNIKHASFNMVNKDTTLKLVALKVCAHQLQEHFCLFMVY